MPCDSNIRINLVLDAARVEVLDAAMKALGFEANWKGSWTRPGVSVTLDGNNLRIQGSYASEEMRAQIQRMTSVEVVKRAAARNGWRLSWTGAGAATATKQTYGR